MPDPAARLTSASRACSYSGLRTRGGRARSAHVPRRAASPLWAARDHRILISTYASSSHRTAQMMTLTAPVWRAGCNSLYNPVQSALEVLPVGMCCHGPGKGAQMRACRRGRAGLLTGFGGSDAQAGRRVPGRVVSWLGPLLSAHGARGTTRENQEKGETRGHEALRCRDVSARLLCRSAVWGSGGTFGGCPIPYGRVLRSRKPGYDLSPGRSRLPPCLPCSPIRVFAALRSSSASARVTSSPPTATVLVKLAA